MAQVSEYENVRRRQSGDLEVGYTDALRRHPTVHLAIDHARPAPDWLIRLEKRRPKLLRELAAEALGVFAYCYCGVGATVSYGLTTANNVPNFGSLLQIAFGYAFGIAFAIIIGATTSGGHFNPAITLCFAVFQGFPWKKVPLFIVAQIFGAFLACTIIYAQWYEGLQAYAAALRAAGEPIVSATGPAGLFVAVPLPTQEIKWVFVNEFFADSFIGLVIWAAIDGSNLFMKPASAPFVIGLAYFVMIGAFGANTLSTNLARDLGARLMAAMFYGTEALTVRSPYVASAVLTNIPATFLGVLVYQLICSDTRKLMAKGHALPKEIHAELTRERAQDRYGEAGPLETYLKKHPTVREDMAREMRNKDNGTQNGYAKEFKTTQHI